MVLLDRDPFLTQLSAMYARTRSDNAGTVYVTFKRTDLRPVRGKKRQLKSGPDATEAEEFTCLVRASCTNTKSTKEASTTATATSGDPKDESDAAKATDKGGRVKRKKALAPTKISTLITSREVTRFTNSLTALQKAAMVDELHGGGMKKKDKSAKKKK